MFLRIKKNLSAYSGLFCVIKKLLAKIIHYHFSARLDQHRIFQSNSGWILFGLRGYLFWNLKLMLMSTAFLQFDYYFLTKLRKQNH